MRDERRAIGDGAALSAGWQTAERRVVWATIVLLVLGAALAGVALLLLSGHPSTSARLLSAVIGALAGGIVGATLSILVSRALDYGPLAQMQATLERTATSTLTAPESELQGLRRVWHHYHQTLVDGKATWRYGIFSFDNHGSAGALTADVAYDDVADTNRKHVYRLDAATRGPRLILVQTPLQGAEAPTVEIFPHVRHGFRDRHAGIGVVQTWDGREVLSATLLSVRALTSNRRPGTVDPREAQALDDAWATAFQELAQLLPQKGSI